MSTEKLGLPKITGNMAADVVRDLNALADAIDKKAGAADGLAQLGPDGKLSKDSLGIETSEIVSKTELNDLKGEVGNADELSTEVKTSIVAAVNELEQKRAILDQAFTTHKAEDAQDAHLAKNIGFSNAEMTATNVEEGLLEVFMLGNSTKEELVDKLLLVDDSLPIDYNSTWQDVLVSISQISLGRKSDSGEAIASPNNETFQSADGSRSDLYYYVSVQGLDFKPTYIFTSWEFSDIATCTSITRPSTKPHVYDGSVCSVFLHTYNRSSTQVNNLKGDFVPAVIDYGMFVIPLSVQNPEGKTINWIAIE